MGSGPTPMAALADLERKLDSLIDERNRLITTGERLLNEIRKYFEEAHEGHTPNPQPLITAVRNFGEALGAK